MLRFVKYGLMAVVVASGGGFLLLGLSFPSYLRTSATSVRQTVQDTVPIEFQLRRTRNLIDQVLPDLQSQVCIIAQDEVAIAGLESAIARDQARLESEQAALLSFRTQMRVQQVSFEVNGSKISREQMTERSVLAHEQEGAEMEIPLDRDTVSEEQVLLEYDRYFSDGAEIQPDAKSTMFND